MAKRRAYSNSRSAIIRLLIDHGTLSRMEIAHYTGLSRAAISLSASELVGEGMVQEIGAAESTGGRPATMLRLGGATRLVAGVGFEADTVFFTIVNLDGQELDRLQLPACRPGSPEYVVDLIVRGVMILMADREPGSLIGCGVALTGQVNAATDTFSSIGWDFTGYPLRRELARRLRVPVDVLDNAHASGLGELWLSGREHREHLVYVYAGDGVGGAIITNRVLYLGRDHAATEFGQMRLDPNGPHFRCGHQGCLEGYLDWRHLLALVDEARQNGLDAPLPEITGELEFAKAIAEASAHGDAAAGAAADLVIDYAAKWLGRAVANLITIFNPDEIVIGGSYGLWGERFAHLVSAYAEPLTAPRTFAGVVIRTGRPMQASLPLGAAVAIINRAPELLAPTARELATGTAYRVG